MKKLNIHTKLHLEKDLFLHLKKIKNAPQF